MTSFNELLASALAPITLISGVGLLMLSMSARYNHATSRIRLLMNERLDPKLTDDERADIDDEIDFIFHRAGLLRRGEFCVVLSCRDFSLRSVSSKRRRVSAPTFSTVRCCSLRWL